jgi:hypothetical protein
MDVFVGVVDAWVVGAADGPGVEVDVISVVGVAGTPVGFAARVGLSTDNSFGAGATGVGVNRAADGAAHAANPSPSPKMISDRKVLWGFGNWLTLAGFGVVRV